MRRSVPVNKKSAWSQTLNLVVDHHNSGEPNSTDQEHILWGVVAQSNRITIWIDGIELMALPCDQRPAERTAPSVDIDGAPARRAHPPLLVEVRCMALYAQFQTESVNKNVRAKKSCSHCSTTRLRLCPPEELHHCTWLAGGRT